MRLLGGDDPTAGTHLFRPSGHFPGPWVIAIGADRLYLRYAPQQVAEIPFADLGSAGTAAFAVAYPPPGSTLFFASAQRHVTGLLLNFRNAAALEPLRQALPAGQSEASWTSWLWNVRIDGSRLLVEWNNLEPEVSGALACLPVPHLAERVMIDAEPVTRTADADSSFTLEILLALAVVILFAFLWTASDRAGAERTERLARLARGAAVIQKQGATAVEWIDGLTWSGCGRGGGGVRFTAMRNGQRASGIFCEMQTQRYVVWDDDHR